MGIDNENEFGPDLTVDGSVSAASTESSWDAGQMRIDKAFAGFLSKDFDPHLTEGQAMQVQEVISTVIRGERDGTNEGANKVYPYEDGDFLVLGPEIFTKVDDQSAIMYKGVAYGIKTPDLQPKDLTKYSVSERVETIFRGDWIPGIVSSKQPGILNVDTERGPVSVGSYHKIRRAAQNG